MNLRKNAGITLIALIITVVILLILAAVSVVALRDTSLFDRTQKATQVYNESRLDEEDKLEGYQYAVDEYTVGSPTARNLRNNSHLTLEVTTADHLTATVTATKSENSDIDLTNFKIMMASGDSDFVPEESDWEEKSSIETTELGTTVYAVLYDGTKYATSTSTTVTNMYIDNTPPTDDEPTVVLGDHSMTVTIEQHDDAEYGSGIDKYYYRYGESTPLTGEYTEVTSSTFNITGIASSASETQYIQTKVIDKAGRATESKVKTQNLYNNKTNITATNSSTYTVSTQMGGLYCRKLYLNQYTNVTCPYNKYIAYRTLSGNASTIWSNYNANYTGYNWYGTVPTSTTSNSNSKIARTWPYGSTSCNFNLTCPYCGKSYNFGYHWDNGRMEDNGNWGTGTNWWFATPSSSGTSWNHVNYNSKYYSGIYTSTPHTHSNATYTTWSWDNPAGSNGGSTCYYYKN